MALALAGPGALAQQAVGQDKIEMGVASANFLAPFPENDTWRALVIGDGLAEGLLGGLVEGFVSEPRMLFQKKHRAVGSLTRSDIEEEMRGLDETITKEKILVAVVMLGLADRGDMRPPNARRGVSIGSDEWRGLYSARIDRIVKLLRRKNVAVYWIGLPIMKKQEHNDDIETQNEIYRERAGANSARFIDILAQSADEGGGYADRGPDIAGKVVRLREADGVSFTAAGYRKLAFYIERDIKRDMTTARNERTIPLAGNDVEQKKINPGGAANAAPPVSPVLAALAKDGKAIQTARTSPQALAGPSQSPSAPTSGNRDQRPDNARVAFKVLGAGGREEQVTVDILRPTLPASVVALVTKQETADKASQIGETMTDTLSNGLMVMRSFTPSNDAASRLPRTAPAAQPFFRALVKGERLPFKPGRADDFRWPREDDLPPPPEPGARPSAAPITSPVELKTQKRGQKS